MLNRSLASLVLAVVLAVPLVTAAGCSDRTPHLIAVPASGEAGKPGTMTVTGTATLDVSPDCADLTLTISTDGAQPGLATRALQAREQQLVAALVKLGLERSDVKLSYLTMNPIYEPNPTGWAQLRVHTYRAEITVTATTHQFEKIGDIMDAGATAGVTSMSTAFRRSDLSQLKKQVRDMALTAAKEKAQQTAGTLGIKLGRVVTVAETPNGTMWSNAYFPQAVANNEARMAASGTLGGTLQPLTLDITIGYELATQI
jgi:uncharacterized protein YggE